MNEPVVEDIDNVPIVEIRCALQSRGRVRDLLTQWAEHGEGEDKATALALLELPVVERDAYPSNRFTMVDERGNSVFVGNLNKETLLPTGAT